MAEIRRSTLTEIRRAGYVENCQHCGVNLYPESAAEPLGCFTLVNGLWKVASLDGEIDCLCLGCTEKVLGSRLPSFAFEGDAMVPAFMLTAELQDRLNPATDGDLALTFAEGPTRMAIAAREFPQAVADQEAERQSRLSSEVAGFDLDAILQTLREMDEPSSR